MMFLFLYFVYFGVHNFFFVGRFGVGKRMASLSWRRVDRATPQQVPGAALCRDQAMNQPRYASHAVFIIWLLGLLTEWDRSKFLNVFGNDQ